MSIIAVLDLGTMGQRMATNLLQTGHDLHARVHLHHEGRSHAG